MMHVMLRSGDSFLISGLSVSWNHHRAGMNVLEIIQVCCADHMAEIGEKCSVWNSQTTKIG